MTTTILDLYHKNKNARHLLDTFSKDYLSVTGQEFQIPETKVLKVDAGKVISGEKGNDESNPGENIILIDTVYKNIRTLIYSSADKTTNLYAEMNDNSKTVIAKESIPYSEKNDDDCALDPDFNFRQRVIGILSSPLILAD